MDGKGIGFLLKTAGNRQARTKYLKAFVVCIFKRPVLSGPAVVSGTKRLFRPRPVCLVSARANRTAVCPVLLFPGRYFPEPVLFPNTSLN